MLSVHVAVGVIVDDQDRVLLSRRSPNAHQGGLWEFPGGKLEAGESVARALSRELLEELGIEVQSSSALLEVSHDYGDKHVVLDVHLVWEFSGEPHGAENQPLAWVPLEELPKYAFPAANAAIVEALLAGLPQRPC
tara:strand:- start:211672 stop:212079 length:408 start_codon:yes stop_codon:yes gene_type:complete